MRVALAAERSDGLDFRVGRDRRQTFRKNPDNARILSSAKVATHNVIVQNGFDFPSLFLGHLSKMLAAVQSLFLPCNRKKNNRRGEFHFVLKSFAQNPSAFQADRSAASVVICPRSGLGFIQNIAVS